MAETASYKNMPIWQHTMRFALEIHELTVQLPATDQKTISTSLLQAAVALPTLIAAGSKAGKTGFRQACLQARESAAEAETLLTLLQQIYPDVPIGDLLAEISDISASLTNMVRRLSSATEPATKPV